MTMHTLEKEVHDLREEYNENGVVVIKNVLNSEELVDIHAA